MAFPVNPVNGQLYTTGGYTYQWSSTKYAWTKVATTAANIGNVIISNSEITIGNTTSNTSVTGNVITINDTNSNTSVTGNIITTGNATSNTSISGNAIITGNALVSASVTGNLITVGNTTSNTSVTGDVITTGNSTSNTSISGNAIITGNALVSASVTGNLITVGNSTSNTSVTGDVITTGNATSNTSISGNAIITGNLLVSASVTGNLITIGDATSNTSVTGNVITVGNASSNTTVNTDSVNTTSFTGSVVSVSGNITGGNILTNGLVSAAGTGTFSNVSTTGAGGYISGLGNIIAGNLLTSGLISATGNITGDYIFGNGSQLTGIDATSIQNGNSNVRVAANSNVSIGVGGTPNVAVFATDGAYISGILSVTGNVTTTAITSTSELTVASGSNGNILISADGSGIVKITGGTGFVVPVGNTAQRPVPVDDGTLRLNSTLNELEVYTSGGWQIVGSGSGNITVTDQQIDPDGTNTVYTLNQVATSASIMVSINGVTQIPNYGYMVTGNSITFAEAPLTTDYVDIRFLTSAVSTPGALFNTGGNSSIQVNDVPEVSFTVNNAIRTKITANGIMDISTGRSIKMPLYTVAQADALTGRTEGEMIYVQNGDSGAACLAVFSGGVWKRVVLGAAISG